MEDCKKDEITCVGETHALIEKLLIKNALLTKRLNELTELANQKDRGPVYTLRTDDGTFVVPSARYKFELTECDENKMNRIC